MSTDEVATAIRTCQFIRSLVADAHRTIMEELRGGVDAKVFAVKYEKAVSDLDRMVETAKQMVAKAQATTLPAPAQQFLADYQELACDLASLRQFLADALAKAKIPPRAIDWKHVGEVEEAHARGEFLRSSSSRTAG
jgi:hypothetical protein